MVATTIEIQILLFPIFFIYSYLSFTPLFHIFYFIYKNYFEYTRWGWLYFFIAFYEILFPFVKIGFYLQAKITKKCLIFTHVYIIATFP